MSSHPLECSRSPAPRRDGAAAPRCRPWSTILALSVLLLQVIPATGAEEFGGQTFYFGELHAHTGLSGDGGSIDLDNCRIPGACGRFWEYFDTARYEAGLDFAAITDHLNGESQMDEESWPDLFALVNDGHDPEGGFVAILGVEVTHILAHETPIGHKDYLLFEDGEVPTDLPLGEVRELAYPEDCDELWIEMGLLVQELGPALLIPHHPAPEEPRPTDWSCHDELHSPVVEIYSSHGNSRSPSDPYDPSLFDLVPGASVDEALDPLVWGHRLGIVGGTDFHDTQPGMICHLDQQRLAQIYGGSLTGIYLDPARQLDRSAIREALTQRHTYATSGPRVPVMLQAADGDGVVLASMGDVVTAMVAGELRLQVSLPSDAQPYLLGVELVDSSGDTHAAQQVDPGVYELSFGEIATPWWSYAIVTLDGGSWWEDQGIACVDGGDTDEEKIWTSPIWIDSLQPPDDDGDGWSIEDGDCDDQDATRYPTAPELCDGLDNDCDGVLPADELDEDGDQWFLCGGPGGQADCDDLDADINPGAIEVDNGVDDDCDGVVDEGFDAGDDDDSVNQDPDGCASSCQTTTATPAQGVVLLALGLALLLRTRRG